MNSSCYSLIVCYIVLLGHWRAMNSDILNIVEPNSTLWFLHPFRGHADQEHTCYGTNSTTSMTSRFRLNVKPECLGGSCIISVHYLHSWNTSYIASATCNLYNIVDVGGDKVHSSHLVSTVNIAPNICGHDNSEPVTGTHMCSHELKVGQLTQEVIFHSIECVNNEFNKLACIGGIEFYVKS